MISIRNHIFKTGCWLRNRPNLPTYLPNPSKSRCLYPLKPVLNSIKPVIEKFNGKYVEKLGIEGHLQENFYPKKEGHGPRRKLIYLPTSYIWSDFEIINAAWCMWAKMQISAFYPQNPYLEGHFASGDPIEKCGPIISDVYLWHVYIGTVRIGHPYFILKIYLT